MQDTLQRVITRERQQLADLEREFDEVETQQEERFGLIERKRRRLADMGVMQDD
ncbi:hypothetical protein [uncultured Roseobacter sp.]|uniref:hypothetical protein n=1 Tax=uncultured Roseobacter sp. TaxID=114847 RepID=UPI00262D22B1|nr:hypothetical protein [uncultured Roseobacter sp.]